MLDEPFGHGEGVERRVIVRCGSLRSGAGAGSVGQLQRARSVEESVRCELADVDGWFLVQHHRGDTLANRGRELEAVPAGAELDEQSLDSGGRANKGVPVRGEVVRAGPASQRPCVGQLRESTAEPFTQNNVVLL